MKREARDRSEYRPKPVERIDLNEKNMKVRAILAIAAILVAVAALIYCVLNLVRVQDGWQIIEPDSREISSTDFSFSYCLGKSGVSAPAEAKAITALYSDVLQKTYKLFHTRELFADCKNICYLNRHLNEPVKVDALLYDAFEKANRYNSRYLFLAPVFEQYENLFFCQDETETALFDPVVNPEIRDYFAAVCAFAADENHIRIELTDEKTVCIRVSDEYRRYAEETGIDVFVDFYALKNAFIIDAAANLLIQNGHTLGYITTVDGYQRTLDASGSEYTFPICDAANGAIFPAALGAYRGAVSLVTFKNAPGLSGLPRYRAMQDGTVRTAYIDPVDGLSKGLLPLFTAYSYQEGCADLALQLLPYFASDAQDETEMLAFCAAHQIYPAYCKARSVFCPDPDLSVQLVNLGDDKTYTLIQ